MISAVLLDLSGVLYIGGRVIPGAISAMQCLTEAVDWCLNNYQDK